MCGPDPKMCICTENRNMLVQVSQPSLVRWFCWA